MCCNTFRNKVTSQHTVGKMTKTSLRDQLTGEAASPKISTITTTAIIITRIQQ